ncbi:hypothetical protein [Jiangella alba]|uniref:Transcriptional regulator, AbiEi antitoxin, Type IV TA system n=1 Tax=Jiangella alba TaxID=561176 RepID=A0A1H5P4H7_9ACTN|nr:hypothetical protein [Jiangella alba]SEF08504.1 Transcriptional regulator, AbiEi antitoxin, Type IV TA system [Jiangella alba]
MARHAAARVPSALLRHLRVLRPQDAVGTYAHPRPEFARLVRAGALHQLATGYYAVVPDDHVGDQWLPALEAAAAGIAAADEGIAAVALMGLSAARVHGALPRAIGVAVVAAGRHRSALHLADRDATVLFVRRDVTRLDVQRYPHELGEGWITTVEQTVLDLAARPELGGLRDEAEAAARTLLLRADAAVLDELATTQRRQATLRRLRTTA